MSVSLRYQNQVSVPDEFEDLEDADLLAMSTGQPAAFAELIRRHQAFVFGAAFRVTKQRQMAEDIAQETFLKAYRSANTFRGEGAVRAWMYRIARNLALNAVTRSREDASDEIPERITSDSTEARVLELERRDAVRERLRALPEPLRSPLVLREYEDMSYEDIAERLGVRVNTVKTRIHRGRALLGKQLKDEHV